MSFIASEIIDNTLNVIAEDTNTARLIITGKDAYDAIVTNMYNPTLKFWEVTQNAYDETLSVTEGQNVSIIRLKKFKLSESCFFDVTCPDVDPIDLTEQLMQSSVFIPDESVTDQTVYTFDNGYTGSKSLRRIVFLFSINDLTTNLDDNIAHDYYIQFECTRRANVNSQKFVKWGKLTVHDINVRSSNISFEWL